MKEYWSLSLFRVILVITFLFTLAYLGYRGITIWYYYLSCVLGFLTLWLFGNLCEDVHRIHEDLTNTVPEDSPIPSWSSTQFQENQLLKLIENTRKNQLGDRIFKTDIRKICQNCGRFVSDEKVCQLDGSSLSGITINAVGCQHWTDKSPSSTVNNS